MTESLAQQLAAQAARLDALSAEVHATRRSLRRWRRAGGAALLCAGALLTMGQAPEETVSAQRFELKDGTGKLRGTLGVREGQTELSLLDPQGQIRLGLFVANDGAATVSFHQGEAEPRMALGMTSQGAVSLAMNDAEGGRRVGLSVGRGGTPGIIMGDGQQVRVSMGVNKGFATFAMKDSNDKIRLMMYDDPQGNPGVVLKDAEGKKSAQLP